MTIDLKAIVKSSYFRQKAAIYLVTALICIVVLAIAFTTQGIEQP